MIGQTIGHYQILEEIGHGGMGVVYKALDTRLNRPVAIKSLQAGGPMLETAQKRFRREAQMIAHLDHPYICKIYEILEQEGATYIVLEYVRGKSLSGLIADPQNPLPIEKTLELGIEIAEALEEAHKNSVVHRDIKPANIMLLESGHIKVLDFGLAKALDKPADGSTATSITATDAIVGTVTHMSPEQIRGQEVDTRSDIFSFGIVLYEMVAGRNPFPGETSAQVAASILNEEAEPLHRYRRGVPEDLDRVLHRMLEKDPNERYQSVHEVRVELRHIREQLAARVPSADRASRQGQSAAVPVAEAPTILDTAAAGPAAAKETTRRTGFFSRSRQWYLGFATAVGVMGVIVFFLYYEWSRPALSFAPRGWILVADFKNETGDTLFDKSLGTAFNVSISQSQYANVIPRSRASTVLQRMGRKPDLPLDEETGKEICQRESITGLICPGIGKIGSQFILTARIVDPRTGESVRSYSERADSYDRVLPALDAIAASVRKGLGESLQAIQLTTRPLERVTTSSLEALQQYSEAQILWSRGKYNEARQLQESAVARDPDFAMAHAALGTYYSSFIYNNLPEGRKHFLKALSLADRTSERERQVMQMEYESHFGTFDSARNLYETFVRSYPDAIAQRFNLGNIFRDHKEYEKAIEQYQEALRIDPGYAAACINLATCYSSLHRTQEALKSYARAFELEPSWITGGNLNHEYAFALVEAGEPEKARQVVTKALSTPIKVAALRSLALLDLYQGKYRDARPKLDEALLMNVAGKAGLSEARNHYFLQILLAGQGDQPGALRELDKAARCLEPLPPQVWLSSRIGVSYARARLTEKAVAILNRIRKDVNPNDSAQNAEFHRLEGEIELARGYKDRAIEILQVADRENRLPLTVESLARTFEIAGRPDEAVATYELLMIMRHESAGWEPQQDWFAAHVSLARLYLNRREAEKAQKVLSALFDLWKGCDPDLPLIKLANSLNIPKS